MATVASVDKLLEITWLDLPDEPSESTAKWQELFNAGWIRRAVADARNLSPSEPAGRAGSEENQ
jgi:hypothetical protein